MSFVRESVMVNGNPMTFETGRLAKQAHGSILITFGESIVLVTAVAGDERPNIDFFPLTCEYVEKTFAAGKIPGGFFKREGRQRDDEILVCRLIDRPCRPLFPEGYRNDTQVIATVLSADKINPTDVLAMTGASAALHLSDIPWAGPFVGLRVARVAGEFIVFPTFEEQAAADLDLVVGASKEAIVMVEGGAAEALESDIIDALFFAHQAAQPILQVIERMRAAVGKPKRSFVRKTLSSDLAAKVRKLADPGILQASLIKEKKSRYDSYKAVRSAMFASLTKELGDDTVATHEALFKEEFEERKYHVVRDYVLSQNKRIDGRGMKEVRPITTEVGLLPRVHGSALFQRGETQAIVTTTLGTSSDEQKIDALTGERWKRFLLHYNFPPFSTGEVKPMRGPGRREIGHGTLAERALVRILPEKAKFPYTIRIVSETLESNGSSSMAAVCGGTLSLLDAGVPVSAPVAGIAMGLISDGTRRAILSDILGDEDHLGDMDFKVCGTSRGVTAIQMDIKIAGLSREILAEALDQAREGRLFILGKMLETLQGPRSDLSKWAPRITTIKVKPDQIRLIIGSGGKTIKGIVDQTGVQIDVEDDGTVNIASSDAEAVKRAVEIIKGLTIEPEIGAVYHGTVSRITDFGAFIEIMSGTDGLLHISEMAHYRVARVEDVMKEGELVDVKVLSIERDGKIRLTRRELIPLPEGEEGEQAKERMQAAREPASRRPGGPPSRAGEGVVRREQLRDRPPPRRDR
ncbi:MAG: polyribonucleotide nucleotidyltransferase [Myxococcales bacterium]